MLSRDLDLFDLLFFELRSLDLDLFWRSRLDPRLDLFSRSSLDLDLALALTFLYESFSRDFDLCLDLDDEEGSDSFRSFLFPDSEIFLDLDSRDSEIFLDLDSRDSDIFLDLDSEDSDNLLDLDSMWSSNCGLFLTS